MERREQGAQGLKGRGLSGDLRTMGRRRVKPGVPGWLDAGMNRHRDSRGPRGEMCLCTRDPYT